MNESQTRLEKITPALQKAGWEIGGNGNSRIITEYRITKGRISKDELLERVYSKKDDWSHHPRSI